MKREPRANPDRNNSQSQDAKFGDHGIEPISVRIAVAVRLTGIPRSTLYELISTGQIDTIKIGRSTFIPYRSLKRLVGG